MKKVIWLLCVAGVSGGYARTSEEMLAMSHGADTKVVFCVKDDQGVAVSNAFVKAGFYLNGEKGNAVHDYTGTDGLLAAEKKSVGEINYWVRKEGYYETSGRISFERNGVSDGRWQPYGATNTVVLKRIVNPVAMCVAWNEAGSRLPDEDCLIGYDMKTADWVKPRGKGETADFFVRYVRKVGANRLAIKSELTIAFTNALDGAYRMKTDDSGSAMRTVYKADTNAVYAKTLAFVYDRTSERINADTYLTSDDYLVLRIRTECDDRGNLKKANYAKIVGKLAISRENKLKIRFYYNPNENDPNLEADTTKNLLNPRDLGFPP